MVEEKMFVSSKIGEDIQWHKTRQAPVDVQMSHPVKGKAWMHFNNKFPQFANDTRNLRLAVAKDVFNPCGDFSTTYNMWLVLVIPLNLPPWQCVSPSNCFHIGSTGIALV